MLLTFTGVGNLYCVEELATRTINNCRYHLLLLVMFYLEISTVCLFDISLFLRFKVAKLETVSTRHRCFSTSKVARSIVDVIRMDHTFVMRRRRESFADDIFMTFSNHIFSSFNITNVLSWIILKK